MDEKDLMMEWFNFCYKNNLKISPIHTALYSFCHATYKKSNTSAFRLDTNLAMLTLGIKNYKTFKKAFDELVSFNKIFLIEKQKNQFSSNIIALVKNGKATGKAIGKAKKEEKAQRIKTVSVNNKYYSSFYEFWNLYNGIKRQCKTEYEYLKKTHNDWKIFIPELKDKFKAHLRNNSEKRQRGEFVPEPKSMKNYLTDRCWEEIQDVPLSNETTSATFRRLDLDDNIE